MSLRRQLDAGQNELTVLQRDKDIAVKENRRLQDDLATMTREAQVGRESKSAWMFLGCFALVQGEYLTVGGIRDL